MDNFFDADKLLETVLDKKAIEEELSHGPIPIPRGDSRDWSVGSVFALIMNPVYTGIGPYAQILPDDLWIKSACMQVKRVGPELCFRVLIDSLRQAFEDFGW